MSKDFSDGKSDGKKEWTRDSRERSDRRSFGDKPRFSRDNDGANQNKGERGERSFNRDRDGSRNTSFGDRPRFNRDDRDSRDSRSFRDNRDNRDFGRDRDGSRNKSFGDRPRFSRDSRDSRDNRDFGARRDSGYNRDNARGNDRDNSSYNDRPRFNRDDRDRKPFGDKPRFDRDSRNSYGSNRGDNRADNRGNSRSDNRGAGFRDNRGERGDNRFDRPRFAKNDRFTEERNRENRPRFDRAFSGNPQQVNSENIQALEFEANTFEASFVAQDNTQLDSAQTNNIQQEGYAPNDVAPEQNEFSKNFNHDNRSDRGFTPDDRDGDRGYDRSHDRGGRFERSEKFSGRDGGRDSGRGFGRGDRNDRGSAKSFARGNDRGDRGSRFERTDLQEVLDLDRGILKLLAKRARFLKKLVTGKMLDAATEKEIRTSWEEHAAKFSRDPKVSRELFLLVQSVEALSESDTDQPFFNLSPAPKPVQVELPAPTSSRITRYYMTLAAASGKETSVKNVPLTDSIIDGLKSLNFMGGDLWYENDGTVMSRKAKGLERGGDKAVHVGKDPLNLWLVLALSLGLPYHLKITGENELRTIDFMPIARFVPKLGARLVQIIPSQEGLPIRIEASGMLPEEIMLPADLPRDFVFALLIASSFWESEIRFNMTEYFAMLAQNPLLQKEWDILFEELEDVFKACDVNITLENITLENNEPNPYFICKKSENAPNFPQELSVPSDAEICTTFFLLPAFTSGYVQLTGVWDHRGSQKMIQEIVDFVGLEWTEFDGSARVKGASDAQINMPESGELPYCPTHIGTLLYTLCAERGTQLDLENLFATMPQMAQFAQNALEESQASGDAQENASIEGANLEDNNPEGIGESLTDATETAGASVQKPENANPVASVKASIVDPRDIIISFLAHIGFNEKLQKVEVDNSAWNAPSAAWAVAFSLGAYLRPRLKLVNPNILNDYYPFYWRMYNTLPNPELKKQERKHDKAPSSRKRVIAQGVYADLADVPQPNPDADADGY